jgi:hypothetical protein
MKHRVRVARLPLRVTVVLVSSMIQLQPGVGIHEGLVWCRNPKLSRLPAHPMD